MSETQLDRQLLRGKRIFLLEEDDGLYGRIKGSLQAAGAAVFGALVHFPDLPMSVPAIRFDVALVDVDGGSPLLAGIIGELNSRRIPIVLMSSDELAGVVCVRDGNRPRSLGAPPNTMDHLLKICVGSPGVPPASNPSNDPA